MAVGSGYTGEIFPVAGIKLAAAKSGIRYRDCFDLVLIELAENSNVAGVFTQNLFCAAPVTVAKNHIRSELPRYFLINTGNANAGMGHAGELNALRSCDAIAGISDVLVEQVLPFSTGVIGEQLPVEKIIAIAPELFVNLASDKWEDAAWGILTTDTRPKLVSTQVELKGKKVTLTGIAKGSGMIKPNMATMLAFVFTDAVINEELLNQLLKQFADKSFNRITVDGDMSTNDCCMLVATGKANISIDKLDDSDCAKFMKELQQVFIELSTQLIKDGEGATKFITVNIESGKTSEECLQVAYAIAESMLVKTAIFASDPNWGRILAAIGCAGIEDLDIHTVTIDIGDVRIVSNGRVDLDYTEEKGQSQMNADEITLTIGLQRGKFKESIWTTDLSHDYISINADYRT